MDITLPIDRDTIERGMGDGNSTSWALVAKYFLLLKSCQGNRKQFDLVIMVVRSILVIQAVVVAVYRTR